jgi:CBS domain-containing protein/SAM-dependent methyltransferase
MLVRDLMDPPPAVLTGDTSLEEALRFIDAARTAVPVTDSGGAFAGTLVRRHLVAALPETGGDGGLAAADVSRDELRLEPGQSLDGALAVLDRHSVKRLPVVDGRTLVGTITLYDIETGLDIVRELGSRESRMVYEIAPGDDMFSGSTSAYLATGLSALRCVTHGIEVAGVPQVGSILDLPCGHGRGLRYLRAVFPDAHITACDIDLDGVQYCEAAFGAAGVPSSADPADIPIRRQFDAIWCGSLLTHLDAPRWPGFLSFFESRLTARGALVFSTHGERVATRMGVAPEDYAAPIFAAYERTGFGYADYPDQPGYGVSLSRREWVSGLIAAETGLRVREFTAAAWDDHHDVFVCTRAPTAE